MAKLDVVNKAWSKVSQDIPYATYTAVSVSPQQRHVDFKDNIFRNLERATQISKPKEPVTLEEEFHWTYNPTSTTSKTGGITAKGSDDFNTLFDLYAKNNNISSLDRLVLTNIAELESGFNGGARNSGSTATGYFLFLDGTRKNLGNTQTRDTFAKDYQSQIALAHQYYNKHQNTLLQYSDLIKKLNLTPTLAMYGMWWRPASMINYLKTGSDSYVNTSDGMTLAKILLRAGKYA